MNNSFLCFSNKTTFFQRCYATNLVNIIREISSSSKVFILVSSPYICSEHPSTPGSCRESVRLKQMISFLCALYRNECVNVANRHTIRHWYLHSWLRRLVFKCLVLKADCCYGNSQSEAAFDVHLQHTHAVQHPTHQSVLIISLTKQSHKHSFKFSWCLGNMGNMILFHQKSFCVTITISFNFIYAFKKCKTKIIKIPEIK